MTYLLIDIKYGGNSKLGLKMSEFTATNILSRYMFSSKFFFHNNVVKLTNIRSDYFKGTTAIRLNHNFFNSLKANSLFLILWF